MQGETAEARAPGDAGCATLGGELALERYRDLFYHSAVGMLIYRFEDRRDLGSFRLMAANPAAAVAANPRVFEHLGRPLRETSPYLLDTDVPRHYAAAAEGGERRCWTITTDERSLAAKTYACQCFPLAGDDIGVVFEDITERRRMEREVRQHVTELERSNRELDDFAYAASHDLKSPLQDVRNLSSWLQEDLGAALPEESARHLRTMVDRVSRMDRLLDDLLAYSRAGRVPAPVEQFTLSEVVDEVLKLSPLPERFALTMRGEPGRLRSPRAPLAQVFRNLIGNAVKHHDGASGNIVVEARDRAELVEVAVSDDGPGIPRHFHERVFRIFQTLRPRDEVEGSGIGLAIVKKVVEGHGGSVWVESEGRGTAVHFTWRREPQC
jgi:signal transduction histidine kinase